MLSLDELAQRVKEEQIETVVLAFSDHYGRLLGKRFAAEYFVAEAVQRGSHACNYLLTTDMEMAPVPGYRFANWERGYGDFHLVPDLNTLRLASWLEKSALVLADVEDEETHRPVSVAPRSILRRQLRRSATWVTPSTPLRSSNITSTAIPIRKRPRRVMPGSRPMVGTSRIITSCRARARRVSPPRRAATSRALASPSKAARANVAWGSMRSTSATLICSRWQTDIAS